jgi:hypothetical protein
MQERNHGTPGCLVFESLKDETEVLHMFLSLLVFGT